MMLLDRAVKRYGAPEQILTDQGTQFTPARGEISAFDRHCSELGIEHIMASVRRPTLVARLKLSIKLRDWNLICSKKHWSFIRYYNYVRPHEGINYLTPAEIYLKD